MEKQYLKQLVDDGLSTYDIAKKICKGQTTVRYWLKKFDLSTDKAYSIEEIGKTSLEKKEIRRVRNTKRTALRRIKFKKRAIEISGGKCNHCGYNKHHEVLEFHHIDPKTKSFELSQKHMGKKWETIENEINKCILLCSNCHKEEHIRLRLL